MLDLKFIRENTEIVKLAIKEKYIKLDLDKMLLLDQEIVKLKQSLQDIQTEKNTISKSIPKATNDERPNLISKGKELGEKINELKPTLSEKEDEFQNLMYKIPNIPAPEAPRGKDESENVVIKQIGEKPNFKFSPKDHVELLLNNNWAEFEKIADVCGSRSYSLRNEMVLLEMAVHQFAMNKLIGKGFTIVSAPSMVREKALFGTGHFPSGRDQVYYLPDDDLYLSGTAEVQLNSLHAGEIINEDKLPILYAGYSSCFRREAGSYGKDVRGLIRVHQFTKVEQYIICKNDFEESKKWHLELLKTSEEIVTELGLPYQIIECCTGDMGTGKVRMYDIECWVPSENKYRETHSCSTLTDWQSRRTNTRYRDSEGNVKHCHTLNNTAAATPRLLVSLIENHQNEDGSLNIPTCLQPFMNGKAILSKK